ncbi:MAG TPA: uroporphyrinogen-III synthase, partial [Stellaceae bacterium]|nr:uroporphyrinogen-III synthase [Stellaceae bacterium]
MKALVTRPREDAASLARAFAERGIEAVIEPMLTIAPVAEGARQLAEQLAGVQALLFTSANGVRAFAAASVRRELPVFVVGDASAAAAR